MITNSDIAAAIDLLTVAESLAEGRTRSRTIALARDVLEPPPDGAGYINDTMPGVKIGRFAVARDDGRVAKITERQSRLLCILAAASPTPVGVDFICRKICDQAVPPADKGPLLSWLAGDLNGKIEPLGLFVKIVRGVGASLQWIEGRS